MSSNTVALENADHDARRAGQSMAVMADAASPMRYAVPLGRLFFALIFLNSLIGHFSPETIAYSAQMGLPMATLLVPLSGVVAFAGGLSIALGYRARLGAWLLV